MTEQELRQQIAKNLIHYRKLAKMTQFDLAEALNYSDKSISKWERADGTPDIFVLTQIAELYHITVNDLLTTTPKKHLQLEKKQWTLVTMMSVGLVWLLAVSLFVILNLAHVEWDKTWLIFIYAIPLSAIIVIVFAGIKHNRVILGISASILLWSTALGLYLSITIEEIWLIFLIGIPLQIITIIWFYFRRILHLRTRNKTDEIVSLQAEKIEQSSKENK